MTEICVIPTKDLNILSKVGLVKGSSIAALANL
jgi:hypothetical protein